MANIWFEALVIGIITAIIGFIIATLLMVLVDKNFKFKNYTFWPQVMLGFFLTGAVMHLVFEVLGWNKKFCDMRNKK